MRRDHIPSSRTNSSQPVRGPNALYCRESARGFGGVNSCYERISITVGQRGEIKKPGQRLKIAAPASTKK